MTTNSRSVVLVDKDDEDDRYWLRFTHYPEGHGRKYKKLSAEADGMLARISEAFDYGIEPYPDLFGNYSQFQNLSSTGFYLEKERRGNKANEVCDIVLPCQYRIEFLSDNFPTFNKSQIEIDNGDLYAVVIKEVKWGVLFDVHERMREYLLRFIDEPLDIVVHPVEPPLTCILRPSISSDDIRPTISPKGIEPSSSDDVEPPNSLLDKVKNWFQ